MIGLAWDCGAVTTGPVTVPLVLALGIGVANAGGQTGKESKLQGFGIVTLASLKSNFGGLVIGNILEVYSSSRNHFGRGGTQYGGSCSQCGSRMAHTISLC